jgi:hypothetical protein
MAGIAPELQDQLNNLSCNELSRFGATMAGNLMELMEFLLLENVVIYFFKRQWEE